MLDYLVEFIGTFIFLSVILLTGEAIPIAIALAAAIYFGGKVSGGNFNPAVSTAMLMLGKLEPGKYIGYVVAQLFGAIAAFTYYGMTAKNNKPIA